MAASSTKMVCAAPLGPVDCYDWLHEGRAPAILIRETTNPGRVLFRSYDANGAVLSDSGWHGTSSQDVCTRSMEYTNRLGRTVTQTAGDKLFILDEFCYAGMDCERTHDTMTFEKKVDVDDDTWRLKRCGCGTTHRISLKYKDSADVWVDPDVTPGPSVVDGMCTR